MLPAPAPPSEQSEEEIKVLLITSAFCNNVNTAQTQAFWFLKIQIISLSEFQ